MTLTMHTSTTLTMHTASEDNDYHWSGLECGSEDETDFDFVNLMVGEMFAYLQGHYDK